MTGPGIPEAHHVAIGRLTVMAAKLESMVGYVAHAARGDASPVKSWELMAGKPGREHLES